MFPAKKILSAALGGGQATRRAAAGGRSREDKETKESHSSYEVTRTEYKLDRAEATVITSAVNLLGAVNTELDCIFVLKIVK